MTRKMSANDWLEKADIEGGALAGLEYGLTHKHLDKDDDPGLHELVKEATLLWKKLAPLIEQINRNIEDLY